MTSDACALPVAHRGKSVYSSYTLFPNLIGIHDYPLKHEYDLIMGMLLKNHFMVLDLLASLKKLQVPDKNLWVHPTDQHPNEKVHRLVSEHLAAQIEAAHLLNRNGRPPRSMGSASP